MARVDQSPEPDAPVAWSPYGTTRSDASLPTIAPGYPWLYAHYPQNWAVDLESGEILPDLTIVPGMPGVADTGREVPGGLGGGDMSGAGALDEQARRQGLRPAERHSGAGRALRAARQGTRRVRVPRLRL
jgi:hypothetical protein